MIVPPPPERHVPIAFATARKLRFGSCDLSGIAYFPDHMHMTTGVMEAVFESIGAPWPELRGKRRVGLPTLHLDVTLIGPGFHGDVSLDTHKSIPWPDDLCEGLSRYKDIDNV